MFRGKFDSLLIYEMKPEGEKGKERTEERMCFEKIINPWERRREITLRGGISHSHHYSSLDSNTKDGQMDIQKKLRWIEVTSWK